MSDQVTAEQEASFNQADFVELTDKVRKCFTVRDRKSGMRRTIYEKCFIGKEAVAVLLDEGVAADVEDALRIGNMLLTAGVFRHVLGEHSFKNEGLFYRFAADDDHGKVGELSGYCHVDG